MLKLNVKILPHEIVICFESGRELIKWVEDDWIADHTTVFIANAVHLASTDPEKLIKILDLEKQKDRDKLSAMWSESDRNNDIVNCR